MDATDYRIVNILLKNGRIQMKDLAAQVSLSAPAAAERVRRLEDAGIIEGYKAVVNYDRLGRVVHVQINVNLKIQRAEKFMEFIEKEESIFECHHVTGPYSRILQARLRNMDELEVLLGKIQQFGSTETYIILSTASGETLRADASGQKTPLR